MRQRTKRRAGFSLVELLAVIAIISLLLGMIIAGVGRFIKKGQEAKVTAEIAQLSNAIAAFKQKYQVAYLPASFTVRSSYGSGDADGLFLKRMFPQINLAAPGIGGYAPNTTLDSNQCLVFFLSGGLATNYTGFSKNPTQPFSSGSDPFYDFDSKRLSGTGHFHDFWGTQYAYFTYNPSASAYQGAFLGPPNATTWFTDATGRAEQQRGFQIVSAGPNMSFGPGGNYIGTAPYQGSGAGADDIANFGRVKQD